MPHVPHRPQHAPGLERVVTASSPDVVDVLRQLAANRGITLTDDQANTLLLWSDGYVIGADDVLRRMIDAHRRLRGSES